MAWGSVPALSQSIVHNLNQAPVSFVIQDKIKTMYTTLSFTEGRKNSPYWRVGVEIK